MHQLYYISNIFVYRLFPLRLVPSGSQTIFLYSGFSIFFFFNSHFSISIQIYFRTEYPALEIYVLTSCNPFLFAYINIFAKHIVYLLIYSFHFASEDGVCMYVWSNDILKIYAYTVWVFLIVEASHRYDGYLFRQRILQLWLLLS